MDTVVGDSSVLREKFIEAEGRSGDKRGLVFFDDGGELRAGDDGRMEGKGR